MRKINTRDIVELTWSSPKGKFAGAGKEVSEELGRNPQSTDLNERHYHHRERDDAEKELAGFSHTWSPRSRAC